MDLLVNLICWSNILFLMLKIISINKVITGSYELHLLSFSFLGNHTKYYIQYRSYWFVLHTKNTLDVGTGKALIFVSVHQIVADDFDT